MLTAKIYVFREPKTETEGSRTGALFMETCYLFEYNKVEEVQKHCYMVLKQRDEVREVNAFTRNMSGMLVNAYKSKNKGHEKF